MTIKITGSGSYIPTETVTNKDFSSHIFLNEDGTSFPLSNDVITEKFYGITGIEERKYAHTGFQTSDMATIAAKRAIENANIDCIKCVIPFKKNKENNRTLRSIFPESKYPPS